MKHRIPLSAYAEAYVQAQSSSQTLAQELQDAQEVLHSVPALRRYLSDRSIASADRLTALEIALPHASVETKNILLLLAEEKRINELDTFRQAVCYASAAQRGMRYVRIESAIALTNTQRKELLAIAERHAGMPVDMEVTERSNLLGGIRMYIGDTILDVSISARLAQLTSSLVL
jgi:F-type H+-transporting ATPase subunit delta